MIQVLANLILVLESLLQILRRHVLVLHQLLFALIQLQNVAIEHLNLLKRGPFHVCQIPHEPLIVHLKFAQIAHAILHRVVSRQLALLIAANHANRFATAFAVSDGIAIHETDLIGERCLAEHAAIGRVSLDSLHVE